MVKFVKHVETDGKQAGEMSPKALSGEIAARDQATAQPGEPEQVMEENDVERRTVFVGDIPYNINENQLKSIFGRYGSIENAYMKHDKITKKRLGYGFITFSTRSEASRAFDQKAIGCHVIRVGWARKNQTLVISNPRAAGGLEEILACAGCNPDVQSTHFNEGGHCIIRFQSRKAAEQFRKKVNGMVVSEGHDPCRISWSNTNFNNVHIHFGKDHSITVHDILSAFLTFGPVEKIVLPQTETGESKGFGFVYYPYGDKGERSAAEAIRAMNGATLCNGSVPIVCNYGHRARSRSSFFRSFSKGPSPVQMNGESGFDSEYLGPGPIYSQYPYYDSNNQVLMIPASYYPIIHAPLYEPGMAPEPHQIHYITAVKGEPAPSPAPVAHNIPGHAQDNEGQISQ